MTRDKGFKRLVRARMAAIGVPYTVARTALLRRGKEVRMVPVTCEVEVRVVTEHDEGLAPAGPQGESTHEDCQKLGSAPNQVLLRRRVLEAGDQQSYLVLREIGGPRQLSIPCGDAEATAIDIALRGIAFDRPMTHDLLRDVVAAMGQAREVHVTAIHEQTYLAELLFVDSAGAARLLSCRPSDGIALAVRAEIPILVADSLFASHSAGD